MIHIRMSKLIREFIHAILQENQKFVFDKSTGDWIDPLDRAKKAKVGLQRAVNQLVAKAKELANDPGSIINQNKWLSVRDSFFISVKSLASKEMLANDDVREAAVAIDQLRKSGGLDQSATKTLFGIADRIKLGKSENPVASQKPVSGTGSTSKVDTYDQDSTKVEKRK